jgi:putative transposase
MLKTIEMKVYLTPDQENTLQSWVRTCCWLYNRALEQRTKAYKRRGDTINFVQQCRWLTGLRERMPSLQAAPVEFERDALRRVDRGMKAFFRRLNKGLKPYQSMAKRKGPWPARLIRGLRTAQGRR